MTINDHPRKSGDRNLGCGCVDITSGNIHFRMYDKMLGPRSPFPSFLTRGFGNGPPLLSPAVEVEERKTPPMSTESASGARR